MIKKMNWFSKDKNKKELEDVNLLEENMDEINDTNIKENLREKVEEKVEERNDKEKRKTEENLRFINRVNYIVNMAKKGNLREASNELNQAPQCERTVISVLNKEINEIDKNEWVWVEGYKGTNRDMKCLDFQFEMDKVFKHEGEVEECASGFHLCLNLEDVFKYYHIDNFPKRYFKVRALVRKKDAVCAERGSYNVVSEYTGYHSLRRKKILNEKKDKVVAKEIEFIEELKFDTLREYIKLNYKFIDSQEKWDEALKFGNISRMVEEKAKEELIENGMSETLALVFLNKLERKFADIDKIIKFKDKYVGMIETGVSKDMCIYLLSTEQI